MGGILMGRLMHAHKLAHHTSTGMRSGSFSGFNANACNMLKICADLHSLCLKVFEKEIELLSETFNSSCREDLNSTKQLFTLKTIILIVPVQKSLHNAL